MQDLVKGVTKVKRCGSYSTNLRVRKHIAAGDRIQVGAGAGKMAFDDSQMSGRPTKTQLATCSNKTKKNPAITLSYGQSRRRAIPAPPINEVHIKNREMLKLSQLNQSLLWLNLANSRGAPRSLWFCQPTGLKLL